MNEDLRALREETRREPPDLDRTVRMARLARERGPASWREWMMSSTNGMKRRPWLVTALGVATIAIVLLAVPISYSKTTGHEVSLRVEGAALGHPEIAAIARELKSAVHAERVTVRDENGTLTWSASVPMRALGDPGPVAQALATQLAAKGYAATAASAPIREKISGSVYAFARDQMITVEIEGKSAPQIESEIRQRLTEAGIPDATVSVTDEPGGKRKVEVRMDRHDASATGGEGPGLGLTLTKNGAPLTGGESYQVKVMHKKTDAGMVLAIEVQNGDRTAKAEIPNFQSLDDAGVAAEIERQLAAAGIQARVTVQGDRIQIEKR